MPPLHALPGHSSASGEMVNLNQRPEVKIPLSMYLILEADSFFEKRSSGFQEEFFSFITELVESGVEIGPMEVFYQKIIDQLLNWPDSEADLFFVSQLYIENGGSEAIHIVHALDYLVTSGMSEKDLRPLARKSLENIENIRGDNYGYYFAQAVEILKSI